MSIDPQVPEEIVQVVREAGERDANAFRSQTEQSLAELHTRIDRDAAMQTASRFKSIPRWVPMLAAASLLAVIGWGVMQSRSGGENAQAAVFQTARGEQKTFALSDGSEMVLGPESHVRFVVGSKERRVELEGQGYFRVKHDAAVPFVVTARNAVATDIGTEFSVRAYAEDSTVDVAVADGVVALSASSNTDKREVLNKGKVGAVARDMSVRTVDRDVSSYTSWASQKLVFENASVAVIAKELSRWFNVDITVDPQVAERHLSAVYDKPTLNEVLDAISVTTGAGIERTGNSVRLTEGGR